MVSKVQVSPLCPGLAPVAPERIFDVEGCCAELFADRVDLRGSYEQEGSIGIDEPADEPGAGDAVDLWPGAGYPNRVAGLI
jgi:hypothetical protein